MTASSSSSSSRRRDFALKSSKPSKLSARPSPSTFSEWIDEASHLEEQGDRYKDGEKARRFYESSAEAYAKACGLKQDADAIYNWGRLLFLLGEYKSPPYPAKQRLQLFNQSIERLRTASQLDPSHSDSFFNLAQSLRSSVELSLDSGESMEDGEMGRRGWGMLVEADATFERAWELQVAEYEKEREVQREIMNGSNGGEGGDQEMDTVAGGCACNGSCSSGGAGGCGCQSTCCSSSHDHAEDDQTGDTEMETEDNEEDDEDYEIFTEQQPVTSQTLIETLTTHASLLTFAGTLLNNVGKIEEAENLFNKALSKIEATGPVLAASSSSAQTASTSGKSALPESVSQTLVPSEIGLAKASLLSAKAEAMAANTAGSQTLDWVPMYEAALQTLDHVLEQHPQCTEAAADKGDLYWAWADSYLVSCIGVSGLPGFDALASAVATESASQGPQGGASASSATPSSGSPDPKTPSGLVTILRNLYATASKAYTEAQTLEPQNASLATRLGDLDATRTLLYFSPSLNGPNPHEKTIAILLKNAGTYYKRALDTLGVSYTATTPKPIPSKDEPTALAALLGYAKVLSRVPGTLGEVKIALFNWKKRGGTLEDSDSPLEFGQEVLAQEWFSKVIY
ncbi:hypothetical protein HDV05_008264 [Chytridiales sp. JEL 0842]|nr:hypothetical protein HDV05_008264 [Chytridiales sp. JEL 0842]